MGVNYYLLIPKKKKYTLYQNILHLGKASIGSKFVLRLYPNHYTNWTQMKEWLKREIERGSVILDEYDREVSLDDFIKMVEQKQNELNNDYCIEIEGYNFLNEEFC